MRAAKDLLTPRKGVNAKPPVAETLQPLFAPPYGKSDGDTPGNCRLYPARRLLTFPKTSVRNHQNPENKRPGAYASRAF